MKRAVWIDYQQAVNFKKTNRYEIHDPYFDGRESLTPEFLDEVNAEVEGKPGIYMVWNHYPQQTGDQFAEQCDRRLKEIGWQGNPALCADIEKGHGLHDTNFVDYLMRFARRWRQLRPSRETHITIEGLQGGLFNQRFSDVDWLNRSGIKIVPQGYTGSMVPHRAGVVQDLMDYGFVRETICMFYDAAIVQEPWDGFLFTQNRLP